MLYLLKHRLWHREHSALCSQATSIVLPKPSDSNDVSDDVAQDVNVAVASEDRDNGQETEERAAEVDESMGRLFSDRHSSSASFQVQQLLLQLREGQTPHNNNPDTETDQLLNHLCHKDFPALRHARAQLSVKGKDKKLDVFFWSRITAMVATLNLYLDAELSYSWREASVIAAKALGRGINHAKNLRAWIKNYLHSGKLPLHRYGSYHSSILEDEECTRYCRLHCHTRGSGKAWCKGSRDFCSNGTSMG